MSTTLINEPSRAERNAAAKRKLEIYFSAHSIKDMEREASESPTQSQRWEAARRICGCEPRHIGLVTTYMNTL